MFSENELLSHLASRFDLRSVILYGSAARGEHTRASDLDVVCFVSGADRYPRSYLWNGVLLDLWIHPVADADMTDEFMKLHDGRTLLDPDGIGEGLLRRITAQLAEPRPRLEPVREEHLRAWVWKMFDRAEQAMQPTSGLSDIEQAVLAIAGTRPRSLEPT